MGGTFHIALVMKPVEGNFARNALEHGLAGLNIDACRVGYISSEDESESKNRQSTCRGGFHGGNTGIYRTGEQTGYDRTNLGRFPANVMHDGSDDVVGKFPDTQSGALNQASLKAENKIYGKHDGYSEPKEYLPDSGSAARFFFLARTDG